MIKAHNQKDFQRLKEITYFQVDHQKNYLCIIIEDKSVVIVISN